LYDSSIIGPDGNPFNLTATAADKGAWHQVSFKWTLSHEALVAQWPLAKRIREFLPGFIPLGAVQTWQSPNGGVQNFLRCVVAHSKPGWQYTTELGSEKRRVKVEPPVGFPFKIEGPITADRTLVWWPQGEEGYTPGKYVPFASYYEALQQTAHRTRHQDPEKAAQEDIDMLVQQVDRAHAADQKLLKSRRAERRKERLRFHAPKVFVPSTYKRESASTEESQTAPKE
jgi:hypothetical protein